MAIFRPFKAFRPVAEKAADIAAPPYDVVNSAEARDYVKGKPLSFLHIGKPEIDLDDNISPYDDKVYEQGKINLQKLIDDGFLVEDPEPYFYLYAQTMDGRTQYGFVGCASCEDYWNDVVKKHEHTRKVKEEDRCKHVRVTNAHSGPIFLTYRDDEPLQKLIETISNEAPDNDHVAEDGIRHRSWVIKDKESIDFIQNSFAGIDNLYVADGHHRSAAAAIVGRERKAANPDHDGSEEYNFFLAVVFPGSHLHIMDYNRVVKDLNGLDKSQFMAELEKKFTIEPSDKQLKPAKKGVIGLYIDGKWHKMTCKDKLLQNDDPVESLDVAILQREALAPVLAIEDPRTSERIDFVGGIRGLGELEKRVDSGEMAVAFAMFPTSVDELMSIADANKIMSPKSTWFEPKLRDGLFVHFLD